MKPVDFDYERPDSLDAVCRRLAHFGGEAKIIAGGQTLVPLLAMRLARPAVLIDINRIAELQGIAAANGHVAIRACTRQSVALADAIVKERVKLLAKALGFVGHGQTRNRGTIGGSLCHLDPSAELVNVTALLGGTLHAASKRGTRDIAFAEFAAAYMTTSLNADELLAGITLPLPDRRCGYAFVEFARRHGDFAIVACSALLGLDGNGDIKKAALALSGLGPAPVRPAAIERALIGQKPTGAAFKAAAVEAAKLDATADAYVTAVYRQHLARVLTFRALEQAARRAAEQAHG